MILFRFIAAFKKVKWPPEGYEEEPEIEPPPPVQLLNEIPMNETAMFQKGPDYKLQPGVYVEEPAELPEDVWPPPEPISKINKATRAVLLDKKLLFTCCRFTLPRRH